MKIITDEFMLAHRIALQDKLAEKVLSLANFSKIFKQEVTKHPDQEKTFYIPRLRRKVQSVALAYYETRYGNFFIKQNIDFRNAVINEITNQCSRIIKEKPEEQIVAYIIDVMAILLEESIKKNIKQFNITSGE